MAGPNDNVDPKQPAALDTASVEGYVADALAAVAAASSTAELKQVRIDHAGDRSPLALANRGIGALPPAERKEAGGRVGRARGQVNQAVAARQEELAAGELAQALVAERVDMTLPVELAPRGALHPITTLIDDMCDVFVAMGWEVAEGPELEAEWYNFDALNLGVDHPARGEQDTLWVEPVSAGKLLRTQTSPVQVRAMLERDLPLYIVSPGKVFRADEYDATHLPVFHQLEGLVVDKGISMADLRGVLDHFARAMFGDVTTRMRPHYFPFTEPSAEVDIAFFDAGSGDNVKWLEVLGCGMVHPQVLRNSGVDPDIYQGYAFGMGIERLAMLRYGVQDLRQFFENDVRFLRQFRNEF